MRRAIEELVREVRAGVIFYALIQRWTDDSGHVWYEYHLVPGGGFEQP